MNRFVLTGLLFHALTFSTRAVALPPPDNATKEAVTVNDTLTAHFSNVDDVGLLLVWNGNGVEMVDTCEWVSGQGGAMTIRLDEKNLLKGRNYVVFALYNKIYAGTGLFAGGKWSGQMKLKMNGTTLWSDEKYEQENDKEIKFWKVFQVDVSTEGKVSVTDKIANADLQMLRDGMGKLEQLLNDNVSTAHPF